VSGVGRWETVTAPQDNAWPGCGLSCLADNTLYGNLCRPVWLAEVYPSRASGRHPKMRQLRVDISGV
jgi:hypothetical protein